jgi:hypothetical protein
VPETKYSFFTNASLAALIEPFPGPHELMSVSKAKLTTNGIRKYLFFMKIGFSS